MMETMNSIDSEESCEVRSALRKSIYHRQASLTGIEKAFLSALLIDKPSKEEEEVAHKKKIKKATKVLNDDILFSIPIKEDGSVVLNDGDQEDGTRTDESTVEVNNQALPEASHPLPPKPTRSNEAQLDLWKAHKDGVRPQLLKEKSKRALSSKCELSSFRSPSGDSAIDSNVSRNRSPSRKKKGSSMVKQQPSDYDQQDENGDQPPKSDDGEDVDSLDVLSDQEVGGINDESTASSWNSSQGGFNHYNAWEVLRDEYAEDFGFKVAVDDEDSVLPYDEDDDDDQRGMFKILGTSHDDVRALPHVLSPPLMDSLMNFVPDHLTHDNFWMKFSLIRDVSAYHTYAFFD